LLAYFLPEHRQWSCIVRALTKDNRSEGVLFRAEIIVCLKEQKLHGWFSLMWMSGVGSQPDSFEELAMPLFDQLYNFAHWLTHNREEAEDLVQETYAKALKGFSSFQLGTNFRAWMYRILRNTFVTSRTGLKVTMTIPLDPEEEDGPELAVERDTPERLLFERSNRELLQSAIDELPVYFREIILLCEVEEMSYQEISETLSVPIGTVMSRLSRARRTLCDRLQPQLQEGSTAAAIAKGTNRGL
jgi:RNA polymerase sigma-70 factor (ECF subfamily)